MIALVEGAGAAEDAQRDRAQHPAGRHDDHLPDRRGHASRASPPMPAASIPVVVLVALFVTLIPTTIGALLSAIGIAGMDRLVRFNVLAMSGRAVEAAGDVDTLLLDKTGTITLGNRQATEFIAVPGVPSAELADAAQLASARRRDARGPLDRGAGQGASTACAARDMARAAREVRAVHGADPDERRRRRRRGAIRKGAVDAVVDFAVDEPGRPHPAPSCERGCGRRIAKSRRHAAGRRERRPACLASSTSRTSSRAASASASPSCAAWASAR